jgi:hypothetical protein
MTCANEGTSASRIDGVGSFVVRKVRSYPCSTPGFTLSATAVAKRTCETVEKDGKLVRWEAGVEHDEHGTLCARFCAEQSGQGKEGEQEGPHGGTRQSILGLLTKSM